MATIVNNPAGTSDSGSGMGFLIGALLLIAVVFLFLYIGLPALNRVGSGASAPQITVPEKVDVNVNTPQSQ